MLQLCFILLTLALAIILYIMIAKVSLIAFSHPLQQKKIIRTIALVLVSWLVYVSVMSVTGIFIRPTFPPRIPLLLVLPAFLFFLYLFTNKNFKTIIANTPPAWPVYFQSFRIIVELLIWWLFINGIFPRSATFEGHNFDILIGLTAPLIAYFTFTRTTLNKLAFRLWNIAGLSTLAIIVAIIMRHAYSPNLQSDPNNILNKGFGTFPYMFLPGFFMPLAVFMHIFSLMQTRKHL